MWSVNITQVVQHPEHYNKLHFKRLRVKSKNKLGIAQKAHTVTQRKRNQTHISNYEFAYTCIQVTFAV